jgi:hypothetical protein
MDEDMFVVVLCEHFGWTYTDYLAQPQWFIDLTKEKMMRDNKERELEHKKMKRGY